MRKRSLGRRRRPLASGRTCAGQREIITFRGSTRQIICLHSVYSSIPKAALSCEIHVFAPTSSVTNGKHNSVRHSIWRHTNNFTDLTYSQRETTLSGDILISLWRSRVKGQAGKTLRMRPSSLFRLVLHSSGSRDVASKSRHLFCSITRV